MHPRVVVLVPVLRCDTNDRSRSLKLVHFADNLGNSLVAIPNDRSRSLKRVRHSVREFADQKLRYLTTVRGH